MIDAGNAACMSLADVNNDGKAQTKVAEVESYLRRLTEKRNENFYDFRDADRLGVLASQAVRNQSVSCECE